MDPAVPARGARLAHCVERRMIAQTDRGGLHGNVALVIKELLDS